MPTEDTIIEEILDHGFVPEPTVEGDHYVLGGYSGIQDRPVLMPGGHGWDKYKPPAELQSKNGLETQNCSNYGTHNSLETLAKFKGFDDFPNDCSERYSGVCTGTTPGGNSPHYVIEVIRNDCGVIPESVLPFSDDIDSWEKYYHPRPMTADFKNLGRKILEKYSIRHEWVFNGLTVPDKPAKLIYALERGTVSLSVLAWRKRGNYYTKDYNEGDNHWVQLLDYVDKRYWIIYDHYDDTIKKLEWDFNFLCAKIYYMEKALPPYNYTRDLTIGSKGEDVKALQTLLIYQGYEIPDGATGYFGPQTKAALAQFQYANGISPAAGYFGPVTRSRLKNATRLGMFMASLIEFFTVKLMGIIRGITGGL